MYFHGLLTIDPSKLTEIKRRKPTRVFGQMLHFLTLGASSGNEEVETFTAVSILQQLNSAFRGLGITNIVRLAKDDVDFYLDEAGKEDDLQDAMAAFRDKHRESNFTPFETLMLVLEHHDDDFSYLIQVEITRRHKVGECPIEIVVNALMPEFKSRSEDDRDSTYGRMNERLSSNEAYLDFQRTKRERFDAFMEKLDDAVKRSLDVDETKLKVTPRIIRPAGRTLENNWRQSNGFAADPYLYGYYGFGDYFLYTHMWSEMMYEGDIACINSDIVDHNGQLAFSVGSDGFGASDCSVLDPDAAFALPDVASAYAGSAFDADLNLGGDSDTATGGGGGWLGDAFSAGGDSGAVDFDSGSSCGSSCGGGCGGE